MGWWARQDSNLDPRDYENHEIIELSAESLRTQRGFPGGASVGNGDRTFCRTVYRTLYFLRARDGLDFLIRVSWLAAFECKSWACATEPDRTPRRTTTEPVRTKSWRVRSARRNSHFPPREPTASDPSFSGCALARRRNARTGRNRPEAGLPGRMLPLLAWSSFRKTYLREARTTRHHAEVRSHCFREFYRASPVLIDACATPPALV